MVSVEFHNSLSLQALWPKPLQLPDNHLLSPVPLQSMSSSAMYYVPVSWSISGTCYCICVCILLQPITQGLCHYIFMSCFFVRSTVLSIFVSTLLQPIYPSALHYTSVSIPSHCICVYILLQPLTQALCICVSVLWIYVLIYIRTRLLNCICVCIHETCNMLEELWNLTHSICRMFLQWWITWHLLIDFN